MSVPFLMFFGGLGRYKKQPPHQINDAEAISYFYLLRHKLSVRSFVDGG